MSETGPIRLDDAERKRKETIMSFEKIKRKAMKISAFASILVFFVVAFEIMIMISPFAFFFYSVFNPIFNWLGQFAATRWLTAFFLPHMILPPTLFLKTIRISGSAFFILGALVFIVCALQIYLGKLFKRGVADKGLYRYVRHPQYLALGVWGIGMSILWPRFIVLATLSLMFILYYFLAKDEERRMSNRYGESYETYLKNTGMFFPKSVEGFFSFMGRFVPRPPLNYAVIPVMIIIAVLGSGFVLREITLASLPFESKDNLTIVSILPEDSESGANAIAGILNGEHDGKISLSADKDYLGYLMPADYIMQGMIANTGGEFHLYKQHNTLAMIWEWVLHPFEHLRASPSFHMAQMRDVDPSVARRHHCPIGIDDPGLDCSTCPYRRVIIDEVALHPEKHASGSELLSFNAVRTPVYAVDLNTLTGEIVKIVPVEKATAWADVPTPSI
jgi:protein-S-isoprenylcysteine O-methyltransferase Ste14